MDLFSLQPYAGKKICVALSGGVDSVVLLHCFNKNAAAQKITLTALTCEHGIRGEESLLDLAFVQELCARWGVPLTVYREDVPALAKREKTGVEEAGRLFRCRCYRAQGEDVLVATAHHRDDFAETVLFRLARGTSLGGLDAFPPQANLVRPLLGVSRAQIEEYAREYGLEYRVDSSNFDEAYTRNRLRRTVLPALEEAVGGAGEHLVSFALRAAEDERYLSSLAAREMKTTLGGYAVPANLPPPLFRRAVLIALKKLGVERDYTEANFKTAERLTALQSGKTACLLQGVSASREYDRIVIYRPSSPALRVFEGEIPFAYGEFTMGAYLAGVCGEEREGALRADADAFPQGCVLRTRREGDFILPFGGGRKSLKKFMTDKKIPARLGRLLPVAAKGREVFAVFGTEISETVKVREHTKRVVYLTARARFDTQ